ncbi:MAG TPA: UDP-glucose 4-epimerase GalE [Patescibacteria group bacterium]|nr:UDP-glucose 4-epimerase GalE [Patescibacteria group bacterium]
MKVFVTGGAGYIGSHTVRLLLEKGHKVLIYDSLEHGHKKATLGAPLVVGKISDRKKLHDALVSFRPDAVIHFAAYIAMGESVVSPSKYFQNNVTQALTLFDEMVASKINRIVFSSSAGVYGNPVRVPIQEDDPKLPTNPYGETKLMVEKILQWYEKAYGLRSMCIRYFNAAGASVDGKIGENHVPETHIIPIAMQVALGLRDKFLLYGDDYDTKDGTCVRDYIHVLDLSEAHILALDALLQEHASDVYNAGTGSGYSNREILEEVQRVSKKDFPIEVTSRRPGDANVLVASVDKIKKELHFKTQYSDLTTIIESAWKWHTSHPKGFS